MDTPNNTPEQNTTQTTPTQSAASTPDNHSMSVRVGLFLGVLVVGGLLGWALYTALFMAEAPESTVEPTPTEPVTESGSDMTPLERAIAIDEAVRELVQSDIEEGEGLDMTVEEREQMLAEVIAEFETEDDADASESSQYAELSGVARAKAMDEAVRSIEQSDTE